MSDFLYMMLALLAGMALGIIFFGGLWFTIKKAVTAKIPALWFFLSFFLRVAIILIGFYYVSQGNWQRLIVCLVGFIIARFMVTRVTKSIENKLIRKVQHEA